MKNPVFKHLMVRAEIMRPPPGSRWLDRLLNYFGLGYSETRDWLQDFVERLGMKLLAPPIVRYVYKKNNRGLTAVCSIETSHIAMHIWDESDPAIMHFDVFSCGPLDARDVLGELDAEFWFVGNPEWKFFDREHGFKEEGIESV